LETDAGHKLNLGRVHPTQDELYNLCPASVSFPSVLAPKGFLVGRVHREWRVTSPHEPYPPGTIPSATPMESKAKPIKKFMDLQGPFHASS